MLTLEQFKEWYEPISKYNKDFDEQYDLLGKMYPDSFIVPSLGTHLLDAYMRLLSEVMNDQDEFISYYAFDCEEGKKPMVVTLPDGDTNKEIILDSLDKLYEIITWN